MIQVVVNDVCSGGDLVLAVGPADVVRTGEAPVIAISGVPTLGVAEISVVRCEVRYTAVTLVGGIVGARKTQNIESDIGTKVGSLTVLAHACKTDVPVHDERWRE